MDFNSEDIKQDKIRLSESIYMDKNLSKLTKEKKEIFLNSTNDYSELRQSYINTQLKNISIDFGFPSTRNSYKYKRTFPLNECPMFEQKNTFYYDKNFQLFKNKSVSKFGDNKSKNNNNLSQSLSQNRLLSPQHKIITSIKKRKYKDENDLIELNQNKNIKPSEKDIYELEVINQVIFNEEDEEGAKSKRYEEKITPREIKESDGEWGEIEQMIFENEKNKKNNLLNSVHVEIEKENGEKQLKIVEIAKEDKDRQEPCIKIKYTVEDKLCLYLGDIQKDELNSTLEKEYIKDTSSKSSYTKTNNTNYNNFSFNSFRKHESSALRKERASEILLKDAKSTENLFSSVDTEKMGDNKVNIKPVSPKFEKEDINPINKERFKKEIKHENSKEQTSAKNNELLGIKKYGDQEINTNKSIEIDEKYLSKRKDSPRISKKEEKNDMKEIQSRQMKAFDYEFDENSNVEGKNIQKPKFNRFSAKKKDLENENQDTKNKEDVIFDRNKYKNNTFDSENKSIKEIDINLKKDKRHSKAENEDKNDKKQISNENGKMSIYNKYKINKKNNEEEEQAEIARNKKTIERYKSSEEEDEYEKIKKEKVQSLDRPEEKVINKEVNENKGIRDKYMKKKRFDDNIEDDTENDNKLKIISIDNKKNRFGKDYSPSHNFLTEKDTSSYVKSKLEKNKEKEIEIEKEKEKDKDIFSARFGLKTQKSKEEEKREEIENLHPIFQRKRFYKENKEEIDRQEMMPKQDIVHEFKEEIISPKENKTLNNEDGGGRKTYRRFFVKNKDGEKEPENKSENEIVDSNTNRFNYFKNKTKSRELDAKDERREREEKYEKEEREKRREKERQEKERERERERERQERENQKLENERKEREKQERIERIEREREKERKEKEREEKERKERELVKERKEKERIEREKQEKIEREREKERKEKEKESIEREREKEREKEREERLRLEREEKEKKEREREKEREKERKEKEKKENERKERERIERIEREKKEKEIESERIRKEKEREEEERKEKERKRKEKLE